MLERMDDFFNTRIDGYEEHQLTAIDGAHAFYPFTAQCLPTAQGCKLLDLGCGTGLELDEYFVRNPSAEVTGIDMAEVLLRKLECKFHDRKLKLIHGSYFEVPFGTSCFDAAVSVMSLHHFPQAQKTLLYGKVYDALRPDGFLILTDYFAPGDEYEQFYMQELRRLKAEQGICDDAFYHYDTPLTVAHETQALTQAGFSTVEVLASWGTTHTLKAIKKG